MKVLPSVCLAEADGDLGGSGGGDLGGSTLGFFFRPLLDESDLVIDEAGGELRSGGVRFLSGPVFQMILGSEGRRKDLKA